jgi:hypothetical protein
MLLPDFQKSAEHLAVEHPKCIDKHSEDLLKGWNWRCGATNAGKPA